MPTLGESSDFSILVLDLINWLIVVGFSRILLFCYSILYPFYLFCFKFDTFFISVFINFFLLNSLDQHSGS